MTNWPIKLSAMDRCLKTLIFEVGIYAETSVVLAPSVHTTSLQPWNNVKTCFNNNARHCIVRSSFKLKWRGVSAERLVGKTPLLKPPSHQGPLFRHKRVWIVHSTVDVRRYMISIKQRGVQQRHYLVPEYEYSGL